MGKITVSIPDDLHDALEDMADAEGVRLGTLVRRVLEEVADGSDEEDED